MKLRMIFGAAVVAAASASLISATPASTTVTPTVCTDPTVCSSVTFTPGTTSDQLTLTNGEVFYFSPTAFTTFGHYSPLAGSADTTAEFTTVISAAPEPASWALMIAGIGLAGGMLRVGRRQNSLSVA